MTKSFLSGSIQIEVPVKPVWPKEREEKSVPAEEPSADFVSQPRARSEPGMPARRVKSSTVSAGDDAAALQDPTVQKHLSEPRQIAGRAEEPGVGSDAAHRESVLVMDLPVDQAAPPGVEFRGSDARPQLGRRPEHRVAHP